MKRRIALTAALLLGTVVPGHAYAGSGRCAQYESLLTAYAPRGGWNVAKMSRIMFRESRCQPTVVNRRGGDSGLLQVHPITWQFLSTKFGVPMSQMRPWLLDPANNVQAAALLCNFWRQAGRSCYQPWVVN